LGYYIQEEIFLRLNLMGQASGIYTVTQCRVNARFILEDFRFRMRSGVVKFNVSGRVEDDLLVIETGEGKNARMQSIRLSKPPMIGVGLGPYFKSQDLRVGEAFTLPIFDPSTMSQTEAVFRVVDKEPITVNKRRFKAFRIETELWGKPLFFWVDEDGDTLKEEGFMGLTTVKSSAANAPRNIEGSGGMDFYELAAIEIDKKLQKPAQSRYLKLKFEGLNKELGVDKEAWHGERQRYSNGVMEVTREDLPPRGAFQLPFPGLEDPLRKLLQAEFNIESDHEAIVQKAEEIIADEEDPVAAARRLLNWVYKNLKKRPVVSVPSALEVLRSGVGDCNEHATLLTALLRASGIPARICIGLVYTRDKFYYHAWTEAYVGKWVSMDATLNQMPADATHIKLFEGNLDKQVEIAGLIGSLQLEVLAYRHD
jgi:hypothetical protein